jgi:hypothetical protein
MYYGKTIQIFLPDGNPRSVKIAEITSRTVQAILIPRSKLDFIAERDELNNVGIYFLIGGSDEDSKPTVYVGEAENCLLRLKQHNAGKDFWNVALVIISKTKFFTKSHIKYLEWFCLEEIKKANRFKMDNSSIPSCPHISEPIKADLIDNFDTIKILVSTLSYPLFDQIEKPEKQDILICKGKDAVAEGEYSEEGFIVFKGSRCTQNESSSIHNYVTNLRRKLLNDGVIVAQDNVFVFAADYVFSSPSTAAAFVLARNANGWTEWKYKNGKTLDAVKRKSANLTS